MALKGRNSFDGAEETCQDDMFLCQTKKTESEEI